MKTTVLDKSALDRYLTSAPRFDDGKGDENLCQTQSQPNTKKTLRPAKMEPNVTNVRQDNKMKIKKTKRTKSYPRINFRVRHEINDPLRAYCEEHDIKPSQIARRGLKAEMKSLGLIK